MSRMKVEQLIHTPAEVLVWLYVVLYINGCHKYISTIVHIHLANFIFAFYSTFILNMLKTNKLSKFRI